jgi:CheY-like chemotaxis protein
MLASDYVVAGVATDGGQAVDLAWRLQPDAIVLDVNMPGVDGFQTLRALREAGLQAPVLFLSMLEAEEVVREAFRCGGRGYVLKSRVASDLATALDHVLLGRLFVPSLTSLAGLASGRGHALHLYGDVASSLEDVAALFDLSLRRGDATCLIASDPVRERLGRLLRARGWDLGAPGVLRRYRLIDPADVMSRCMRGTLPDPVLVGDVAAELDAYRLAATDRPTSRLTVFGNIAASLDAEAAIALERVWNAQTRDLPFLTVCGYPASFSSDTVSDVWASVCAEHAAVSHANHL